MTSDYPYWDESLSDLLESTDKYFVENEIDSTDNGGLRIRRTVWKRAYRRNDRHILWIGVVMVIPPDAVRAFVIDAIDARVASGN